jgi:predicted GNAT superfamily acetyltransferase
MTAERVIRLIEDANTMLQVESLQRVVWPGSETSVVPVHVLRSTVQHGGILIGAWIDDRLAGFVYGFPGAYATPDGLRLEHYSHMLAVHPDYRAQGIGFVLKRAQWQMVRHQGIDRITWTYDPLLSRNAWLNITRLGAVCNIYYRDFYGSMQDDLNKNLPSDRFQVDWWVNSSRVTHHLSRRCRPPLTLAHYLSGEVTIINPASLGIGGWMEPGEWEQDRGEPPAPLLLVEIPEDFLSLKADHPDLALHWREHTRQVFEALFQQGYLVTDFIHLSGKPARSYYVLCYGESTL